MASYKGHLSGGIVAFIAVHYITNKIIPYTQHYLGSNQKEFFLALSICLLGSLFPDIDIKSVGQRIFYIILTVFMIVTIMYQMWNLLAILSLISVFPLLVNHRGITHNIWFLILAPLVIASIIFFNNPIIATAISFKNSPWLIYLYFEVGVISHLILDYGIKKTFMQLLFK